MSFRVDFVILCKVALVPGFLYGNVCLGKCSIIIVYVLFF